MNDRAEYRDERKQKKRRQRERQLPPRSPLGAVVLPLPSSSLPLVPGCGDERQKGARLIAVDSCRW